MFHKCSEDNQLFVVFVDVLNKTCLLLQRHRKSMDVCLGSFVVWKSAQRFFLLKDGNMTQTALFCFMQMQNI